MRMHDIICDADGWAYHVDGVKQEIFPTWFMAMTAARKAAERDLSKGIAASFRHQGTDGQMLPVQTNSAATQSTAQPAAARDVISPSERWERGRLQA